jgi:hypothetical protein
LFRYRSGDLVKPRRTPDGLVLEDGILGRMDDMVIVRGVNLYPSALEAVVRSVPEIGWARCSRRIRRWPTGSPGWRRWPGSNYCPLSLPEFWP